MSFCEEILTNCDECLQINANQCSVISIITDLIEDDTYYLHLLDKFENHYVVETTIGVDGELTIDPADFDKKLFIKSNGKLEVWLSTQQSGQNYDVPITINEIIYNCIIVSFNE